MMSLSGRRPALLLNSNKGARGGFTIIELAVVIGIMLILLSASYAGYPVFRRKISLKRTAQEVALAIRQAQAYALGVKEFKSSSTRFYPGYGVYFSHSTPGEFILFADLPRDVNGNPDMNGEVNYQYDAGEEVERFKIDTTETVSGLYSSTAEDPISCKPPFLSDPKPLFCGGYPCPNKELDKANIIFYRPVPLLALSGKAYLVSDDFNCGADSIEIKIGTSGSDTKSVVVSSVGQVQVQ